MLLNMALVWLMIYFSICLMIIISICSMIIVSREYFEITFISHKKGLCWPSFWDYLHFDIRSAQSIKAIFDAPRFEMIYAFHLQMSRKIFVHKIIFVRRYRNILMTKMPRRSGARITSQLDNLRIPYNKKYLPAKSVAFQLLLKECKYMYGTCC